MIISRVHIDKFRGFKDAEFSLGEFVTLIAGQNGTQKSTLLGMISQPFTISKKDHPLYGEKPLSGENYRSTFKEKFRLSPIFDQPKEHEWTLHLVKDREAFTLQSIIRNKLDSSSIRFWKKGSRAAGSGYIQLPVIYLSLKRLIPLGEENDTETSISEDIALTPEEINWFVKHYQNIMINRTDCLKSVDYVKSPNKNTLGITTNTYDWNTNSAGQDNIGKILLAILSFKRLKEKHAAHYEGGLLAIDEIDATLYPGSQVKLLESFFPICKEFKIQIIATTHSLTLLEKAYRLKKSRSKLINIIYLKKQDDRILVDDSLSYERIVHNLSLSLEQAVVKPKVAIYTEDKECIHFVKAMLGRSIKDIDFINVSLGCNHLMELASKKVPSFIFPNSIVILDGDARNALKGKRLSNFVCLPGLLSPERVLAQYLYNLPESDAFWTLKSLDYSKQYCFNKYSLEDILSERKQAKSWYNDQIESKCWGLQANLIYKEYFKIIPKEVELFINEFTRIHSLIIEN
jgi:AAA15 family ATPase/GTPase